MFTAQIIYGPVARQVVEMFVRLSKNMLDEDLLAGAPVLVAGQHRIVQVYGQSPSTSGSVTTFTLVGDDLWEVTYDDGDEKAVLSGPEINKWFYGEY